MSVGRSSSQTRRKTARKMQMKQNKKVMKEVLEGRMVEEEETKGSHSPISDCRRPDVFILVLLLRMTVLN